MFSVRTGRIQFGFKRELGPHAVADAERETDFLANDGTRHKQ